MNFSEAYRIAGPDTMVISKLLDIPEHEADRLINARMDKTAEYRATNARIRAQLRVIRSNTGGRA